MKFSEQMTLIAKGYSKKEIDELKKLEAEELAAKEADAADDKPDEAQDQKNEADDTSDDKPDYEKLYNELNEKYTKLESDLKDIQKAKVKENAAPAAGTAIKEQEEALIDIARSFM